MHFISDTKEQSLMEFAYGGWFLGPWLCWILIKHVVQSEDVRTYFGLATKLSRILTNSMLGICSSLYLLARLTWLHLLGNRTIVCLSGLLWIKNLKMKTCHQEENGEYAINTTGSGIVPVLIKLQQHFIDWNELLLSCLD